jgi:hypothetical protein
VWWRGIGAEAEALPLEDKDLRHYPSTRLCLVPLPIFDGEDIKNQIGPALSSEADPVLRRSGKRL